MGRAKDQIMGIHGNLAGYLTKAVEPRHTVSEYTRNIVALSDMKLLTAELFEPKASFRLSRNEL